MTHLGISCNLYDAGVKTEALRLATIVYTMVHDVAKDHSILGQLGIKHRMLFMSSAATPASDVRHMANRYTPLIELSTYRDRQIVPGRIMEFVPVSTYWKARGKHPLYRELQFEDWWESDIIFFHDQLTLTRKKLVFVLRSQEGGSHFDKEETKNPHFKEFVQPIAMFSRPYGLAKTDNLELATMRQIAEELALTIQIYNWRLSMRKKHGQAS